jgi:protease I
MTSPSNDTLLRAPLDEASGPLAGLRVAFVTANEGVEQVELVEPWNAVVAAGGRPELIAPQVGPVQLMNHLDRGDVVPASRATADVEAEAYDAVVLPGGVANPDQLRLDGPAVALVRALFEAGKPAAVICHGPWTLVEAGLVAGRTLTSWPSLHTDITNAGGTWVDREVQVCTSGPNTLVTSRKPDDLPAFCDALTDAFSRAAAS